jgi:hypothetical protein
VALITPEEVRSSLEGQRAGLATMADPDIQRAIDEAEAELSLRLGYDVGYDGTTLELTGQGSSRLYLTERVRTITSVTVDGDAITGYELQADGWELYWESGTFSTGAAVVITGAFGYASTSHHFRLARKVVRKWVVGYLSQVSPDSRFPAPPGAVVTSYTSEGTTFTYFTAGDTEVTSILSFLKRPSSSSDYTSIPIVRA